MSSDNQFTALGKAVIGFQTDSDSIDVGADISGIQGGIRGRSQGPGDGDGVQGFGTGTFSGVAGFSDPASNGIGTFGQGRGPGATGVRGLAGTGDADGVQGFGTGTFSGVAGFGDPASNGIGTFGQGRGPGATGVRGLAGTGDADGVQGFGTGTHSGVAGFGDPASNGTGVFGQGSGLEGPGVKGIGAGAPNILPSTPVGVYGVAAASGDGEGVRGEGSIGVHAVSTGGFNIALTANGTTAGYFVGNVFVDGNLTVFNGSKSAAVALPDGTYRQLYCLESPESWFEDVGSGALVNGRAEIRLDPDFAATVHTDQYHVFITEYDGNNALYVTARSAAGFEVRAGAGAVDASFSYRVMAKRKDIQGTPA